MRIARAVNSLCSLYDAQERVLRCYNAAVRPAPAYDCRACGACCVNLPSNQAEAFTSWVEVEPDDPILDRADLVRKLVVRDGSGVPHLRLLDGGRCAALIGAPGRRVSCRIYHVRPSPCRRVQPGDALCERYRTEHGLAGADGTDARIGR